jgi:hypothetical protein
LVRLIRLDVCRRITGRSRELVIEALDEDIEWLTAVNEWFGLMRLKLIEKLN